MSKKIVDLMSEFASKYNLGGLEQDERGRYQWLIDNRLIQVFSSVGKVYVLATIRTLPKDDYTRQQCLRTALKASLTNAHANREALFIDPEKGTLCLYRCVSLQDINFFEFEEALESFMYALDGMSQITQEAQGTRTGRMMAI